MLTRVLFGRYPCAEGTNCGLSARCIVRSMLWWSVVAAAAAAAAEAVVVFHRDRLTFDRFIEKVLAGDFVKERQEEVRKQEWLKVTRVGVCRLTRSVAFRRHFVTTSLQLEPHRRQQLQLRREEELLLLQQEEELLQVLLPCAALLATRRVTCSAAQAGR
jgi:hypothetical protein